MRRCTRMRRRLRVGLSAVYVLLVYLISPAAAHIPEIDDDIRIEPTPVLMAGPSSSQIVGFIRFPLDGSSSSSSRGRNDHETQEEVEGSGFGRTKRDYSLEDFLVWMASGDGSTEEWQHRPRDTSWMRREVTTTTVYLTTTVYTTVLPAPFTPSTFTTSTANNPSIIIQPSAVTPIVAPPTKYPDNVPESANSVHIIDKGGGKNLDDSFSSTATTSGFPNKGGNTNPTHQERPQSDYASSHNSGNVIPGSPTSKGQTTEKQGKTSFITITKTVTAPPTGVPVNRPVILTTTSSSDESQYDITDLIHTSLEYPGPSATFTTSSVTPTPVHVTEPMLNTLSPASQNFHDCSTKIAQPTPSDSFVPVTPTAVFSSSKDDESYAGRETPMLIIPSSTSPSPEQEVNTEFGTVPSLAEASSGPEGSTADTTQVVSGTIDTNYSTYATDRPITTPSKTAVQDISSNDSKVADTTTEGVMFTPENEIPHGNMTSFTPQSTISSYDNNGFNITENPTTPMTGVTESSIPAKDEGENDLKTTDIVGSTLFPATGPTSTVKTLATELNTLLSEESSTSSVTSTFVSLIEEEETTVTKTEDLYQTSPSSEHTQAHSVVTSSEGVSDVSLYGNDYDFSTETGFYSTTKTPVYTFLVPNSSSVFPSNQTGFSDTPIFLTSTAGVDVVDPAPIDAESESEAESDKTTTASSGDDYSTLFPTDFTVELDGQMSEESTPSPFTTSTTPQFSPDVSDTVTQSSFDSTNTTIGEPGLTTNSNNLTGIGDTETDADTGSGDFVVPQLESDVTSSTISSEFGLGEESNRTGLVNGTLDQYSETEYSITVQISPTATTKSHMSSGIEASLSVVLLPGQSDHVTQPFDIITPSALPSLPYPGDSSSANVSDYGGDHPVQSSVNVTISSGPVHQSSVPLTTVQYEISSVDVQGSPSVHPTLQPSPGPSGETDTSFLTSTAALPGDKSTTFQPSTPTLFPSEESSSSDSPEYSTKEVIDPKSTSEVLNFTSDIVSTIFYSLTSTTSSSLPGLSTTQTSQITTISPNASLTTNILSEGSTQESLYPVTSDVSVSTVTTSLEDSIIETTQGGSLTPSMDSTVMPKMTTTLTTGAQPSPPSPSNNATVPLDQRYWVRTVLEGPPKEEDTIMSWSRIQTKLTEAYQLAFKRSAEALKYKNTLNQKGGIGSGNQVTTTEPTAKLTISPTTVNPYENYTTIVGRRRREVVQDIRRSTIPWQIHLSQNAIIPSPPIYKMSTGLKKDEEIVSLKNREIKQLDFTDQVVKSKSDLPAFLNSMRIKRSESVGKVARKSKSLDHAAVTNPFLSSRTLKATLSYSPSVPVTFVGYPTQRTFFTWHSRMRRAVPDDISVRLHNVTYDNVTDVTELVYTVFEGEWPILASEAVGNMSTVDDMEMAVLLDQVVVIKAEEYLSSSPLPDQQQDVYIIIGGVVGGVMLLVFILWCAMFLYKRKAREEETLQPDSQEVTPRSQLSTNAYLGHVNLGYSDPRDEKAEAAPMPSTSQPVEDDPGRSSPSGSHDHLIRPRQGPSHGSASKLDQHFYRRRGRGDAAGDRSSGNTSREGSVRDEEDYATSEEEEEEDDNEATTLRRPKSSVPWKKSGRLTMDEHVYSSPKPISSQDLTGPSVTSRYETTHSEMSSSDPTQQLMANILHGAQIFTSKDQGSIFLPPPLLPPPKGFGRSQDPPFIPGTSLPRFLPPPRPLKNLESVVDGGKRRIPSQIDAYSYDPEAPPIPPRNYTREEAGLPPIGDGGSPPRPPMKDAEVEARIESEVVASSSNEDRMRRPSESSSHLSDSGMSESSMPNVGRLRRRFHDLLDDAFSLLSGQRPGDKVTPLTTPTMSRKTRSKSAAVPPRPRPASVFQEEPDDAIAGRPWSAAAIQSVPGWKEAQVAVGVIPLDQSRSPRSAWGDSGRPGTSFGRPSSVPSGASRPSSVAAGAGRPSSGPSGTCRPGSGRSGRSITPVNMPPTSPEEAGGRRPSTSITNVQSRAGEPIDPDTGLRASDPAVPLIRAIKEELKRFKSSVSTDTSNA
ncbi:mucin-22-like isoform X2 [Macrobrachium rosenbergii]|uniref:mucin-22-like isoform X2 n=1 Tax=Macrobrachium rosenbergii TaxID=79674 RepID=UPI0034D39F4E